MTDVRKEKIETRLLSLGMYIAELDRPWEGTPFLLQGFVLDSEDDLAGIQRNCQHVFIDRTKSIGEHYAPPPKQDVAIKREGTTVRIRTTAASAVKEMPAIKKAQNGEKVSFMDIMRDLRGKNDSAPVGNKASQGPVTYNMRYGGDSVLQTTLPYDNHVKNTSNTQQHSVAKQLVGDISGFVGGLFRKDKLKTSVKGSFSDSKKQIDNDDSYRITIYEEEPPVENEIAAIYPVYEQSQIATRDIFDAIATEQDVDISAVSEILDSMVESIGRTPDALLWLAKLKQTDDYAYNHALNVSITLMAFANFLALSKKQVKDLGLAGLLQDVGKVKISSDILLKTEKLTREEFEHAKKHVDESLELLRNTANISVEVLELIAQHHERIDGSGYPKHLTESQISVPSQAAGLIDTYCAMTSHKTYAKGVYHQQALEQIHHLSGHTFSPQLVDQLVQFMGIYPVSSLVELNTGEVAVVIQQNLVRRLLPRLMILLDNNKQRYEAPVILNLLNNPTSPNGEPYRIFKSLPPDSYGLNPNDFYI